MKIFKLVALGLLLQLSAQASDDLFKQCLLSDQGVLKDFNRLKIDEFSKLKKIKGLRISSGENLLGKGKGDLYFTQYFFDTLKTYFDKIPMNLKGKKNDLESYSYYRITDHYNVPSQNKLNQVFGDNRIYKNRLANRLRRGGGRDHVLKNGSERIAVKGSGVNEEYSTVNGGFDIRDFRANGLLLLDESLLEMAIYKIYKNLGVPITEHTGMVMLPKEFNEFIVKQGGDYDPSYKSYAVQIFRKHELRESNIMLNFSKEGYADYKKKNAMKLIAKFYTHNIGHGALNHENISAGAKVLDLGHTSPGIPYYSTINRCLMNSCRGMEGSTYDSTFVGILDHYFGNSFLSDHWRKSYSFFKKREVKTVISDVGREIISQLNGGADTSNIQISDEVVSSLVKLFKDRIKITDYSSSVTDEIFQKKFPIRNLEDSRKAVSVKFTLQLAVMKNTLPTTKFKKIMEAVKKTIEQKSMTHFDRVVDFFASKLKTISEVEKSQLFTHFLPRNFMEDHIQQSLRDLKSYDEIVKRSRELVQELEQGVSHSVEEFSDVVLRSFSDSNI